MWLNRKRVLPIVDIETNYQKVTFIHGKSSHDIWNDFIDCWASVYTGFPDAIILDIETSFVSKEFRENAKYICIHLQFSRIEAHLSIVKGEIYHYPLRGILDVVKKEYKHLPNRIILWMSIKSINDNMGPNGLVPSLLVYIVIPTFPGPSKTS